MEVIHHRVKSGDFILLPHAIERSDERSLTRMDIAEVLTNGVHEADRDRYSTEHDAWKYSILGITVDERTTRVIVALALNTVVVITVFPVARHSSRLIGSHKRKENGAKNSTETDRP